MEFPVPSDEEELTENLPDSTEDIFEARLSGNYARKRQRVHSDNDGSSFLQIRREQNSFAGTGLFMFAFVLGLIACTGFYQPEN